MSIYEDNIDAERLSRWRRYRPKPLEELQDDYLCLLTTSNYKSWLLDATNTFIIAYRDLNSLRMWFNVIPFSKLICPIFVKHLPENTSSKRKINIGPISGKDSPGLDAYEIHYSCSEPKMDDPNQSLSLLDCLAAQSLPYKADSQRESSPHTGYLDWFEKEVEARSCPISEAFKVLLNNMLSEKDVFIVIHGIEQYKEKSHIREVLELLHQIHCSKPASRTGHHLRVLICGFHNMDNQFGEITPEAVPWTRIK